MLEKKYQSCFLLYNFSVTYRVKHGTKILLLNFARWSILESRSDLPHLVSSILQGITRPLHSSAPPAVLLLALNTFDPLPLTTPHLCYHDTQLIVSISQGKTTLLKSTSFFMRIMLLYNTCLVILAVTHL